METKQMCVQVKTAMALQLDDAGSH